MKNCALIFLFCLFHVTVFSQQASEIRESFQTFKTYPFSDPDPIANPGSTFYPYFRFDGFSRDWLNKNWKVIEMENDYLKVFIFPEIGGKIWGAIDKTNGNDFIYYNDVVKFRDIAMRGAWTSGGIELNFGIIGHAPTSSTPVNYLTRTNDDGSVSCFLSDKDRITGTIWSVEVNLPKDKAFFTTKTTWFNPSPIDVPYYQWMNAAYHAGEDLEFIFPAQQAIGHGGEVEIEKVPYDKEGRNILWYKNNAYGSDKSYHMIGNYSDFYAAYWHKKGAGSVHYAPYDSKLGMKMFLWGMARSGAIWEDLLTDSKGQYVELQSGRMMSQAALESGATPYDITSFSPYCTDSWIEHWFPVSSTRGLVKANPYGSLNIIRENGYLKIYFSPVQKISAVIKISDGSQILYSKSIEKDVLELFTDSVQLSEIGAKIKVTLGDNLLSYSEFEEDFKLNRPTRTPDDFKENSIYRKYADGVQKMNYGQFLQAEISFKKCLEIDSFYVPALNKLAMLSYRRGKYEETLDYCRVSLSINTYDGESNYLFGLVNSELEKIADSKAAFSISTYSATHRSAAFAELSKLYVKEKDWLNASKYSIKSLEFNTHNIEALHTLLVICRYAGNEKQSLKTLEQLLAILPLDQIAMFEKYLLERDKESKERFISLVRNEFPGETFLEMAKWYMSIDCNAEALELLAIVDNVPLADYYLAYLLNKLDKKEQAIERLEKANSMSPIFVFPNKPDDLEVFRWAAQMRPDWKIDYYSALVYWLNGELEQAKTLLNNINSVDFAPLFMTRAMLKSGSEKLADLLTAEKLDPQWRTGKELINYYLSIGDASNALGCGEKYYHMYPSNNYLGLKYARTLIENRKFQEAANHLKKIVVLPNEGSYEGREVYSKANLNLAMEHLKNKKFNKAMQAVNDSRLWLENLGVGKPYDYLIDNCIEDFLTAWIYEKQGKTEKATEYYKQVIKYADNPRFLKNSNNCMIAYSFYKTDSLNKASDFIEKWSKVNPGSDVVKWCNSIISDDNLSSQKGAKSKFNISKFSAWKEVEGDYNFAFVVDILQTKK